MLSERQNAKTLNEKPKTFTFFLKVCQKANFSRMVIYVMFNFWENILKVPFFTSQNFSIQSDCWMRETVKWLRVMQTKEKKTIKIRVFRSTFLRAHQKHTEWDWLTPHFKVKPFVSCCDLLVCTTTTTKKWVHNCAYSAVLIVFFYRYWSDENI